VTDELLRWIAAILNELCRESFIIEPHLSFAGANIGRCRSCGVLGQIRPDGSGADYEHLPSCVVWLNGQVQHWLRDETKPPYNDAHPPVEDASALARRILHTIAHKMCGEDEMVGYIGALCKSWLEDAR